MWHRNLEPVFIYIRQLLERYKDFLKPNEYLHCADVINQFYRWYSDEVFFNADDLYLLICDEGDVDGKCLYDYAEYYEESEVLTDMWECIVTVLMFMSWIAYQNEEAVYIPQDLESINIEKVESFFGKVNSTTTAKELLEHLISG